MWSKRQIAFIFSIVVALFGGGVTTIAKEFDSQELAGGAGSTINFTKSAFELPAKNITKQHRKDFAVGRSIFRQNWIAAPSSVKSLQGLGPTFNTQSCVACHANDGRGRPPLDSTEEAVGLLFRMSVPGKDEHGGVVGVPHYGDQLNPRSILNVTNEGIAVVNVKEISGVYPDGQKFSLAKPIYTFEKLNFGPLPEDVMISPRTAPVMIGLGLLEAISEKDLLKNADPEDKDKDGISGRPNYVWDLTARKKAIGRFGWKSNQPTVFQQNSGALMGDMGITSKLHQEQNCPSAQSECLKAYNLGKPEISDEDVLRLTNYAKTISVPFKRKLKQDEIIRGRELFAQISCTKCHVPHYKTGVDSSFPENSNQNIYPYTDLLLHDMGDELADNRPDFEADGNEWRTPPLWGVGLIKTVNGHTRFMHDGRARSIEEAILWHGGEGQSAKTMFMALKVEDRSLLIKFVESL